MAVRLDLRHPKQKKIKADLRPSAMPANAVKEWIENSRESTKTKKDQKEKQSRKFKSFFDHIRELSGDAFPPFSRFGLREKNSEKGKAGWGSGKDRERWARVGLLLKMVPKLLDRDELKLLSQKPSKETVKEKISPNLTVEFKLTQGWRNYACHKKAQLKNLVKAYGREDFKGVLPLLDPPEDTKNKTNFSVQSLKREANRERYLLLQVLLEWEKSELKKRRLLNGQKGYVSFKEVLDGSDITDFRCKQDIQQARNACMHDDIWERRFSDIPEPFKSRYSELEEWEKQKRHLQREEGRKRAGYKTKERKTAHSQIEERRERGGKRR